MSKLNLLSSWSGRNYVSLGRSAQSYFNANLAMGGGSSCGSSCGTGGGDNPKPNPKPGSCGSACGTGDK